MKIQAINREKIVEQIIDILVDRDELDIEEVIDIAKMNLEQIKKYLRKLKNEEV